MPPQPVTSPTRRFVLTRVDGAVETNVAVSALLPANYTTDRTVRAQAYDSVAAYLAANPGVHLRLYSPSNLGNHTDGDCVWDSAVCGPLF